MVTEEKSWKSVGLNRKMTIRIIGEDGIPVLVLPDRNGNRLSWEKSGMAEAIAFQLENGYNQLFCIDSADQESFLNPAIDPEKRKSIYTRFESYIIDEVIPFMVKLSGDDFIILAGVELGGLFSMNLALRYPFEFGKIITMAGIFDPDVILHSNDEKLKYCNNPMAYLEHLTDPRYLDAIRKLDIRLAIGKNDPMFNQNLKFSEILNRKGIPHVFDVWGEHPVNGWSGYRDMFVKHIV